MDKHDLEKTDHDKIEPVVHPDAPAGDTTLFPLPPIPSRTAQTLDAGQRISVYIAGSRAVQHGVQPLGITAYLCGVTGRRYVFERILDKRHRRYGAVLADPRRPEEGARSLVGGGDVFLVRITDEMLIGVKMPAGLAVVDGVIEARLQLGATVEDADKALSRALAPRSLNAYLATDDGQQRLREAGISTAFRFCTLYSDIGPAPRLSEAHELFLVRPRREMQGLLDAISAALAGWIVI